MILSPSTEFLTKQLRFVKGNPFLDKQAEDEEQLSEYFVDLPEFYKILDVDENKPQSSILSASRGCGKSANRRNVERWLRQGPPPNFKQGWVWEPPILVVPYTNFDRVITHANGDFSSIRLHQHIDSILWNSVEAFITHIENKWNTKNIPLIKPEIVTQLGFYLVNYSLRWAYLKDNEANPENIKSYKHEDDIKNLEMFFEFAARNSNFASFLKDQGPIALINGFLNISQIFGVKNIVILIDGVDENLYTSANPISGANLLAPLLAEMALMKMPGLYFKFFLPDDVVLELMKKPEIRLGDKIKYYEIIWSEERLVQKLLSQRLLAFSNGKIWDLAQLAAPDAKEVSNKLAKRAKNNPRTLLNLCEILLGYLELSMNKTQESVDSYQYKTDGQISRLQITKEILDATINLYEHKKALTISTLPKDFDNNVNIGVPSAKKSNAKGWEITSDLQVRFKGRLISSEKLAPKEYDILHYFLEHSDMLVKRDELGQMIWGENWNNRYDWVLTQTIHRLRKKIGDNHIETIRGIGYIFHSDRND